MRVSSVTTVRSMLTQGVLVIACLLGLGLSMGLSSCSPVTTSPLKSSFAPRYRPQGPVAVWRSCEVVFLPLETAERFKGETGYAEILTQPQVAELRQSGEADLSLRDPANLGSAWADCIVAYRPEALEAGCHLDPGFVIQASGTVGSASVRFRFADSAHLEKPATHCALAATEEVIVSLQSRSPALDQAITAARLLQQSAPNQLEP